MGTVGDGLEGVPDTLHVSRRGDDGHDDEVRRVDRGLDHLGGVGARVDEDIVKPLRDRPHDGATVHGHHRERQRLAGLFGRVGPVRGIALGVGIPHLNAISHFHHREGEHDRSRGLALSPLGACDGDLHVVLPAGLLSRGFLVKWSCGLYQVTAPAHGRSATSEASEGAARFGGPDGSSPGPPQGDQVTTCGHLVLEIGCRAGDTPATRGSFIDAWRTRRPGCGWRYRSDRIAAHATRLQFFVLRCPHE